MPGATRTDKDPADKIVRAHSSAIQITHRVSLVQHKAWLILLRNAYYELPDPTVKKHRLRLSELATYLGYKSNRNDGYLKKLLEDLVDTTVTWNIFEKESDAEWGVAAMLAGCKVKGGVVEYDYSTFLREKLHNPKMFALLNLKILNQFKSKYALALYNLCKDYVGVTQTPYIELDQFRDFMGLEKHEYPDFKSLNRRVIKEPIQEINKLSDIFVSVEYTRYQRRVAGLRFRMRKNPQLAFDLASINNPPFDTAVKENKDPLYRRLLLFGLSGRQAGKALEDYPREYIAANLDVVERQCESGAVRNVAAYTLKALAEDFRPMRPLPSPAEERGRQERRSGEIKRELESFNAARLEGLAGKLAPGTRKKLEQKFLEENKGNVFIADGHAKEGFKNLHVRLAFQDFLSRGGSLPKPSIKEVNGHLRQQGFDPAECEDEISEFFEKL